MGKTTTKKVGIWLLAITLFMAHIFFRSVAHADEKSIAWQQTSMESGDCSIAFPVSPQMVRQELPVAGGGKIAYDIYLAPFEDRGVFLLLVATYPAALPKGQELAGVQGLIRGIIAHHPDNKLVFAEEVSVQGHRAINFLVQSGSNYFRGQALMVGSKLFLVAMEGQKELREENVFLKFAKSFSLKR